MNLNDEQLQKLEEYAASLLPASDIAILIGIEAKDRKTFEVRCKLHEGTAEYEAYNRGRLTTKLELRQNIIKLAKAGSPAAEPLAIKFMSEQNL